MDIESAVSLKYSCLSPSSDTDEIEGSDFTLAEEPNARHGPDGDTAALRNLRKETIAMAVELKLKTEGGHRILVIRATGKFSKEDYEHFLPEVERLIKEEGKIRLLFEMQDFHGWEAGALWEDIKFDLRHFADIARLAMVGEKKWEELMATFCKPFTSAEIRYFDHDQIAEAERWIAGD
jgi:hypothetical protein